MFNYVYLFLSALDLVFNFKLSHFNNNSKHFITKLFFYHFNLVLNTLIKVAHFLLIIYNSDENPLISVQIYVISQFI